MRAKSLARALQGGRIKALVCLPLCFIAGCTGTQRKALVPETIGLERSESDGTGATGTDLLRRTGTIRSEGWTATANWNAHALLGIEPEPIEVRWTPRPIELSDDYEGVRETHPDCTRPHVEDHACPECELEHVTDEPPISEIVTAASTLLVLLSAQAGRRRYVASKDNA